MNLKIINSDILPISKNGRGGEIPRISLRRNGVIVFNETAVQLMELTHGLKLSIAQNSDSPKDWYFFIDKEKGYILHREKKSLAISHRTLVTKLKHELNLNRETNRLIIAGQPTIIAEIKYWCILNKPD